VTWLSGALGEGTFWIHESSSLSLRPMRDYGDEDDIDAPQERSYYLPRAMARELATWRFRNGGFVCYYPARRLPTPPDHDGGDEEPRLERRVWTESL